MNILGTSVYPIGGIGGGGGVTDHTALTNIGVNTHDQIDTFINSKAQPSGICDLDATGKIPTNRINLSGVNFLGTWNASTNMPAIISGSGTTGDYYLVSVAGTTNIDGISVWGVGDEIIFDGVKWNKIDKPQGDHTLLLNVGVNTHAQIDQELINLNTSVNNIGANLLNIAGQQTTQDTNISNNTSSIATNTTDITTIQGQQTTQDTNISNNASAITTIQGQQTTQDTNISNNASAITTIQGQQTTQDTNIGTNTSNIATNATNIGTLQSKTVKLDSTTGNFNQSVSYLNEPSSYTALNLITKQHYQGGYDTLEGNITTNASAITTINSDQLLQNNNISTNASAISTLQSTTTGQGADITLLANKTQNIDVTTSAGTTILNGTLTTSGLKPSVATIDVGDTVNRFRDIYYTGNLNGPTAPPTEFAYNLTLTNLAGNGALRDDWFSTLTESKVFISKLSNQTIADLFITYTRSVPNLIEVKLDTTTTGTTSTEKYLNFRDSGGLPNNYSANELYDITFDAGVGNTWEMKTISCEFEHSGSGVMYDHLGIQQSSDGVSYTNVSLENFYQSATTTPPWSTTRTSQTDGWIFPQDETNIANVTYPINSRYVKFYFTSDNSSQRAGWDIVMTASDAFNGALLIKDVNTYANTKYSISDGAYAQNSGSDLEIKYQVETTATSPILNLSGSIPLVNFTLPTVGWTQIAQNTSQVSLTGDITGSSLSVSGAISGSSLTASGAISGSSLTVANIDGINDNVSIGLDAGSNGANGFNNVSIGRLAGDNLGISANGCVSIGRDSKQGTGNENISIGDVAGSASYTNGFQNICIGSLAGNGLTSGNNNIFLGRGFPTVGQGVNNNMIVIGNGIARRADEVIIGNSTSICTRPDADNVTDLGYRDGVNDAQYKNIYITGNVFQNGIPLSGGGGATVSTRTITTTMTINNNAVSAPTDFIFTKIGRVVHCECVSPTIAGGYFQVNVTSGALQKFAYSTLPVFPDETNTTDGLYSANMYKFSNVGGLLLGRQLAVTNDDVNGISDFIDCNIFIGKETAGQTARQIMIVNRLGNNFQLALHEFSSFGFSYISDNSNSL